MASHEIKVWPEFFQEIILANKTAEFRKNDRGYQLHDTLHLREWNPADELFTGRETHVFVTHIVEGGSFGIPEGYCVMSIRLC